MAGSGNLLGFVLILCTLWISIRALSYPEPPKCTGPENRKLPSQDPHNYWICLNTDPAIKTSCPPGRLFSESNGGCVPWESFPWRTAASRTAGPINCGSNANLYVAIPHYDPSYYWVCTQLHASATLISCPAGKGYINGPVMFGCVDWVDWMD